MSVTNVDSGVQVTVCYRVEFNSYTPHYGQIHSFLAGAGVKIELNNSDDVPMDFYVAVLNNEQYQRFSKWLETLG